MIEKTWTTKAGLPATVVMTRMGHRCGYVGVPETHPLYRLAYSDPTLALREPTLALREPTLALREPTNLDRAPEDVFEVHGGLTYSDWGNHVPLGEGFWYFGYDCGHFGDESLSLEFCEAECESLAKQLAEHNYAAS